MRRALLIFMIAMLPLQWVWAAAATTCQHEACASAQHFGHHAHKHDAGKAAAGGDLGLPGGDHADCGVCHLSAAKTCGGTLLPIAAELTPHRSMTALLLFDSHIPSGLERPNRVATP